MSCGNDLNDSMETSSFITSPNVKGGRRRVSISSNHLESRKSLDVYPKHSQLQQQPKDNDDQRQLPIADPNKFGITLNSLHEINSKAFNPNNAFKYNFIKDINSFIENKSNFKIIAMSLDAGTKLYASKVDLIYNNTQKISSSLSLATEEQGGVDGENEIVEDDRRKEKERKKYKKTQTITTNLETINGKLEKNIEIDPLFHHLSAAFDVGNVSSLLLANLAIDPNGALLLDSDASLNFDNVQVIDSKKIDFSFIKPEYAFEDHFICKPYSNFEFLRRDISEELEEFTATKKTNTEMVLNFDFDLNADVEEPIDRNYHDDFNIADFSDIDDHNSNHSDADQNTSDTEFERMLQMLPDENENNEFFNRNFLRKAFKSVGRYQSQKADKKPKEKRVRNEHVENNFDFELSEEQKKLFEPNKDCVFQKHIVGKWYQTADAYRCDDYYFCGSDPKLLNGCFTRKTDFRGFIPVPNKNIDSNKNRLNEHIDNDLDDDFGGDDIFGDNFREHSDDAIDDVNNDRPFNFVNQQTTEQPAHVDALDIDYAKVAKKVDMKRVKSKMWELILKDENAKMDLSSLDCQTDSQKPFTFNDLRCELPKLLSANQNEVLSTPMSFVALLHVCNEKNLKLKNNGDLGNFQIEVTK